MPKVGVGRVGDVFVMEEMISGFSKDEIFELYQFLKIYESDIKSKKLKKVILQYPRLADSEWTKLKKDLTHLSMKNQSNFKTPIPPNTLLDGEQGIVRTRVINHIRNAIVHHSFEKDSHYPLIFLTDKYNWADKKKKHKKGDFSAQYFFDENLFWKIIRIFTKPENNETKNT